MRGTRHTPLPERRLQQAVRVIPPHPNSHPFGWRTAPAGRRKCAYSRLCRVCCQLVLLHVTSHAACSGLLLSIRYRPAVALYTLQLLT